MKKKELEERLKRLERNQERLIKLWEENLQIGAVYPFASLTTQLDKILSEMELKDDEMER